MGVRQRKMVEYGEHQNYKVMEIVCFADGKYSEWLEIATSLTRGEALALLKF